MRKTNLYFTKMIAMLWLALFICAPAKATFTLKHRMGIVELPAGEGQDALYIKSGQQIVHTDSVVIYSTASMNPIALPRPDKKAYTTYIRWYNYDTDEPVSGLGDRYTSAADTAQRCNINNARGKFRIGNLATGKSYEASYKNVSQQVIRIAADMSAYKNYEWTINGEDTTFIEPTISKRLIYIFRPAAEIAARVDAYKNSGDNYMEVHEMIAPTGRQLYIGPDYPIFTRNLVYCNYFYKASGPKQMGTAANWQWSVNGGAPVALNANNPSDKNNPQPINENTIINGQYKSAYSTTPGEVIYTLQYKVSDSEIYNIAKFHVTYKDVTEVGPTDAATIPQPSSKMQKIYEETFNYNRPGTTNLTYYTAKHLPVDHSSYGCYYPDIAFIGGPKSTQRPNTKTDLTSGEYGLCNWQDVYASTDLLYNHVDGTNNIAANANEGYFLYVDGSDKQGEVFSLDVDVDLCPGATMYFYAWLIDGSSSGSGKAAPNMDIIVIGEEANGAEHILTTYTTGEFGINAKANVVTDDTMMKRGKWYQIMFPVRFTTETTYPHYELKILNKGKSNDGNDFAIDDIRVYIQQPPVMPLQASTAECVDKAIDTITAYMRVDYNEIDYKGSLFFQWRDEDDQILQADYYNMDSTDNKSRSFGRIPVKQESELTSADICSSLLDFDSQFNNTKTTVVRYINEKVNLTDSRYVMYLAMPIEVRPNHTYTGFVSPIVGHLGNRNASSCGTFADLLVSGGTRITINDEITSNETVDVCGHRSYDLNIVLTQVVQDYTTENLRVDTLRCKADWLIGDSLYVDQHQDIYRHSFKEIQYYLGIYYQNHNHPQAKSIVEYLQRQGLLILDTFGISMTPELSLSYTAFPRGKVKPQDSSDSTDVCSIPRFLHIQPITPASNMMVVGDPDEDKDALPDVVKDRPRIVRISDEQKRRGWFDLPLYLIGDENETYEVDVIYTISSNAPNWQRITLNSNKPVIALKDTIRLSSEELKSIEAGYDYTFHIAFLGESSEDKCDRGYTYFTLRIVPDSVTWYGGDWNLDASWNYFIPTNETKVILQSQDYDVTFAANPAESFDFNYKRNHCSDIYIPASASMAGQEHLEISGTAYVDIPVPAQKWALTSIPIKGIVSGDLFVSQNESTNPFIVAHIQHGETTETAYDRYTYEVYDSPFDVVNNKWTRPDSILDRPIRPTDAVMVGIDCANAAAEPVIRLPKPDNTYYYYDMDTHLWRSENQTVTEDKRANIGKPAWDGSATVTLTRAYNNIYVFGNPTFGYIDLTQLVIDNDTKLTGKYYLTTDGISGVPGSVDFPDEIDVLGEHVLLPPCRGVLLQGKSESDQLDITISNARVTPSPAPKHRILQYASGSFQPNGGVPIAAMREVVVPVIPEVTVRETDTDIYDQFAFYENGSISTLNLYRTLYRDGAFNTLCLPFSMSAAEIAASPIAGVEIYQYERAEKTASGLDIYMTPVSTITAGKPYLVKWDMDEVEPIPMPLIFHDVHITELVGDTIGTKDEIRFAGNIAIGTVELMNENHLFVGANNTLYWPEYDTRLKGFRAHFRVPTTGPVAAPKNTPARIVLQSNTTTDMEIIQASESGVQKLIIDGMVYILRDGKLFSILGQHVK